MKKDNFKRQISIKTISLGVIILKSFSSLFSRKVIRRQQSNRIDPAEKPMANG